MVSEGRLCLGLFFLKVLCFQQRLINLHLFFFLRYVNRHQSRGVWQQLNAPIEAPMLRFPLCVNAVNLLSTAIITALLKLQSCESSCRLSCDFWLQKTIIFNFKWPPIPLTPLSLNGHSQPCWEVSICLCSLCGSPMLFLSIVLSLTLYFSPSLFFFF